MTIDNCSPEDMPHAMQAFIYRCSRKADTYVYLRQRDDFAAVPEPMRGQFGALQFVMELALSPERRLAREDAAVVCRNLLERGFHVQFPPPSSPIWEAGVEHE